MLVVIADYCSNQLPINLSQAPNMTSFTKQTDRQPDRHTERQTDRHTERKRQRDGERRQRQTNRQADRQTGRQTDRQNENIPSYVDVDMLWLIKHSRLKLSYTECHAGCDC